MENEYTIPATSFVSLECLAATLSLPQSYVKELALSGVIPSLNVRGRLRFNTDEVRKALNQYARNTELLNCADCARQLGVEPTWLEQQAQAGIIPSLQFEACCLFNVEAVRQALATLAGETRGVIHE